MLKTRMEDFLEFAIHNEIDAARLYEKSAMGCKYPAQRQLLEKMASMERGHEKTLATIRDHGGTSSLLGKKTGIDLNLSQFLVETPLTPESQLEDVLIFCIKAEQKAHELYSTLSTLEDDPETKALLEKLASEEMRHKTDLESHFEKEFLKEN